MDARKIPRDGLTRRGASVNITLVFSAVKILNMVYLKSRPFLLNHKINLACDCHCRQCDSWKKKEDPGLLLRRDEIETMIDQAAALGMLSYSVWGGEPLLREDTAAVLAYARRRGFFTTLSTNGSHLAERASDFVKPTSLFVVSLDGIGKNHDQARGFPGLFDLAVKGIETVRRLGGRARIWFIVNSHNAGDLGETARLAKELKVSIGFFPLLHFDGYNDDLVLSREAEREIFDRVLKLQAQGLPIVNLPSYLKVIRDGRAVACHFPKYHIYVDYDGTLYTCDLGPDLRHNQWGNVRDKDLLKLFQGRPWKEKVRELEACNRCRVSCGEIGAGSPLLQFPVRALLRIRYEWLFQRT